jgi:hypothetical protein
VIVCGSDVVKFGRECNELVKSAGSRDDERCRIKNDAVRYADLHCLLDEAAIRTISLQRWSEVETDKPEVVPRFAYRVVNNDEGTTWRQRVTCEIERLAVNAVIHRDCGLVCVGAHHVQRYLSLWYKFVPKVDWKRRVSAGQYGDEMLLEGLYSPFSLVCSVVEGWGTLVLDMVGTKVKK